MEKIDKELVDLKDELRNYADAKRNEVFKVIGGFGLVIAILSYFGIQGMVQQTVDELGAAEIRNSAKAIQNLRSALENPGAFPSFTVGGVCFEPRVLVRCYSDPAKDHLTWVDNHDDCTRSGYPVEREVKVLAECEG